MKYAVIAAGEGSRLAAEGIESPKPLVKVGGELLIDRLIRIFMDNDAEEIVIICNDQTTLVARHLLDIQQNGLKGRPIPLRFMVKSTPSSMHSFFELSRYLADGPFCLTTVDTIFREEEFKAYIAAFKATVEAGSDGLMGVTDYIDDEKPLYVDADDDLNITAFLDKSDTCRLISGGIYGLTPKAITTLNGCIDRGESRMRNFQRALINDGQRLKAYKFSKVLDIDHASDIRKAEEYLIQL
ncbi:MAG: sugar phosphate nucleotidyltransferase [Prevotellaceae bacterium]|nr:sugar phosphate nucleotidyltransferase [Prevotellaceae bacterium]MDD5992843.1 sugar phosphate nucleotidyltransferase [Prevotellaceae bacterium]MDD6009055.1 sugar phosphate nucleotidyltransferase [Prevotellaceae bacterium]